MVTTFTRRLFILSAALCAALFTAPVTPVTADLLTQTSAHPSSISPKTLQPVEDFNINRFEGETRYETAVNVAIAMQQYPQFRGDRYRRVVIARGDNYADAIAAAPLARGSLQSKADGPVLLTPYNTLHPEVERFLDQKVDPSATIFIMGGHEAISPEVEDEIRAMGFTTKRFAGANRADTAAKASVYLYNKKTQDQVPKWRSLPRTISDGTNWYDSLIASSTATRKGGLVLLTFGSQIPETTWDAIRQTFGPMTAIGEQATRAEINGVARITAPTPEALSLEVAKKALKQPKGIGFVTTEDYADALTAAPILAARGDYHLIFVSGRISPEVVAWAKANNIRDFFVFGGKSRISNDTLLRFMWDVITL